MDEFGFWITPLLLLPGIGMLLLSTSIRYNRLHDETHHLEDHHREDSPRLRKDLARRAKLFRDALLGLYVAVALLALASLAGGLAVVGMSALRDVALVLTGLSVVSVAWASALLVMESRLSLHVVEEHLGSSTRP